MTDLTLSTRRARVRAARASRTRSPALVVALMMALVFVPVLGLHAAALSGAVPTADANRPAELASAAPKKAPG